MYWALVLALVVPSAVAGKRKKQEASPPLPPIPAALSLPADRAPVHAHTAEAPALLGSNLDLRSLSRTEISWTIGVDLSFLDGVDLDLALRQLAVDPAWRVGREEGGVVAVARLPVAADPPSWTLPWHGYDIGETRCGRTGLTFSERTRAWAWNDSDFVSTTKTTDAEHRLTGVNLVGSACRGLTGTALVVEGPLTLEVFEAGPETERPYTLGVIDDIQVLRMIAFSGARIEKHGYSSSLLPDQAVRSGHPTLELEPSSSGLVLEAWQNPGAAGWSWVRILDGALQPWEQDAVATATLERVGWSADSEQRFLMQAEIPLPPGKAFSGTVEIWLVPDGEQIPVRVDTAPIEVPAR